MLLGCGMISGQELVDLELKLIYTHLNYCLFKLGIVESGGF